MERGHVPERPAPARLPDATTAGLPRRRPGPGDALRRLQRSHGNHYVQRLIQRKTTVGAPDDRYERESDRIARLVTRATAATRPRTTSSRRRAGGEAPVAASVGSLGEIDAGTRIEVLKISTSQDVAHIDDGHGRKGYVRLSDLEKAIGRRLG